MKNKWFDIGMYWQGLRRLRVVGMALAILCISICVLVPATRWSNGPSYMNNYAVDVYLDGEEVVLEDLTNWEEEAYYRQNGADLREYDLQIETIRDGALIVPVTVLSYVAPFLVLAMFDFLNKRKESDFYHAIPLRRSCVYTSLMAALLTWIFGIFIVSALSAALVWALCPFVTFSFSGLLTQLLYACLNAALLSSFASVAVSLTGTSATSFVTTLLVCGSWRFVLGVAYVCLNDMLRIMDPETFLGGYLHPNWILSIAMVSGEVRAAKIWYAVIVTLLMFALGGVLYVKRRSELAERSVPGRWVHILLRSLITLPLALLLTYMLLCDAEFSIFLILFVGTLLVFYLYELLTTKSARRMVKATPWLGAILGLCLVFAGVMHTCVAIERNENTDEDRVAAVTMIDGYWGLQDRGGLTEYQVQAIKNSLSDDPRAIALVCEAWGQSQGNLFPDGSSYGNWTSLTARIQLKNGRILERKLKIDFEKCMELVKILKQDLKPNYMPSGDEIGGLYVHQTYNGDNISLFGEWRARLVEAMRHDYERIILEGKPLDSGFLSELRIRVIDSGVKEEYLGFNNGGYGYYQMYNYQYVLGEGMPETVGVLYDLFALPAYGRAHFAHEALDNVLNETYFDVTLFDENGEAKVFQHTIKENNSMSEGVNILLRGVDRAERGEDEGTRILMYVEVERMYDGRACVFCPVRLTAEEYAQLLQIWSFE